MHTTDLGQFFRCNRVNQLIGKHESLFFKKEFDRSTENIRKPT
jgi:hypothetical protein